MLAWLKQRFSSLVEQRSTKVAQRDTVMDEQVIAQLGGAGWPARIRQLSTKELILVAGSWHQPGTRLTVKLLNKRTGDSLQLEAQVTDVVPRNHSKWLLVTAINQPISSEQLKMFV
ncbi:MAG: hypothetical protein AB7K24_16540 [Gemmataceae bacterium]